MALPTATPYGLRDIKLTAYTDAAGTTLAGTSVDLPYARTLSFTESEDFEELRGDDQVITKRGKGPIVSWDLESGGISLAAYAIIAGGAVVNSGTGATEKNVFTKNGTDARPWFQIEGQAISDSGGDYHAVIFRCRTVGDISGEFGDGQFWLTSASGEGYSSLAAASLGKLYTFTQNAAVTANV